MTLSLYNGADLASPLKRHLRDIVSVVNGLTIHRSRHLDTIDLSTGSPTEAVFEIPDWARQVELMINGVSLDGGTDEVTAYLGTGGSLVTTGYSGAVSKFIGGVTTNGVGGSNGFRINASTAAAVYYGSWVFTRQTDDDDIWMCRANIARDDVVATYLIAGSLSLAGALDRVGLSRTGSTDAFDAGTVGCRYAR